MNLKTFLTLDGNSEAKLAEALGVSQSTINRYANGKRWPDQSMIVRIKAATDNAVGFTDWFDEEAAQ
jgi:transcriptional regulator with XRE-family HTH domain